MKPCIMCHVEFNERDLDFLGRCEPCFHKWMETPEDQRVKMSVPYVPIYNGGR
jgi:hypothetical protein